MDYDYLKQKRILLVDDEQELLDMVVSILNEDGFQNIKTAKTVSIFIAERIIAPGCFAQGINRNNPPCVPV